MLHFIFSILEKLARCPNEDGPHSKPEEIRIIFVPLTTLPGIRSIALGHDTKTLPRLDFTTVNIPGQYYKVIYQKFVLTYI